jgi:predicted RNase H-like HicB family nuclease
MRAQRLRNTSKQAQIVCPAPILTVLLIRDDQRFMAKCPQLDLVTEMDTPAAALHAMVEMIREYAEDYRAREELLAASPNRAHHKPYIERILACRDEWELWELLEVLPGTFAEILRQMGIDRETFAKLV